MKIHFIGIKGSGMSSLALICKSLGYEVTGSDVDFFIFTQKELEEHEIPIYSFDAKNIKDNMSVVIGNAFDASNLEVKEALANKTVDAVYYYEFLGRLIDQYESISVAGTHGKTTSTSMIKSLLVPYKKTGYLIGDGTGVLLKNSELFVVESCEFQDHFLNYHPDYALITNIDLDHVDYFKSLEQYIQSFQTFVNQVKKGVVLFGDDNNVRKLSTHELKVLYYGLSYENDIYPRNLEEVNHQSHFNLIVCNEDWGTVTVDFIARHNLCNLLGSIGIAHLVGVPRKMILEHISDFKGTHRRFNVEDFGERVYIDDYAHHPTEIRVTIEACRLRFDNKRVVIVYKPDRVSRTQYFETEFREALLTADAAYVIDFPPTAFKEDPSYSMDKFLRGLGEEVIYLSDDLNGVSKLAENGDAIYLFVSTKDVYKYKDKLKEFFKDL